MNKKQIILKLISLLAIMILYLLVRLDNDLKEAGISLIEYSEMILTKNVIIVSIIVGLVASLTVYIMVSIHEKERKPLIRLLIAFIYATVISILIAYFSPELIVMIAEDRLEQLVYTSIFMIIAILLFIPEIKVLNTYLKKLAKENREKQDNK